VGDSDGSRIFRVKGDAVTNSGGAESSSS